MFDTIIENQPGIDAVYEKFIAAPRRAKAAARAPQASTGYTPQPVSLDDNALLVKAQAAKDGEAFKRLLDGDWVGYPSQSEADQAFCNKLAFWTGKDPARMDRIFRSSGLYRDKWDNRHGAKTYGEMTIDRAIEGTGEAYQERRQRQEKPKVQHSSGLPMLTWNEAHLPQIIEQVENIVIEANRVGNTSPIFQRGSSLVRIGKNLSPAKQGTSRSPDAPQIFAVGTHFLQNHLTAIANWQKWNERKQDFSPCACPKKVADTLLDMAGKYRVQPLTGLVNAPILRPDCSILEKEGYDADTGLYCDFGGVKFPAIPQNPTRQDAERAAALLLDVISEFPFKTEADRSVAFAFLLTGLVRRSLPTAPGFAISATVMATGKTRLANLASHIAYGCPADNITYCIDEAEMHKRVFSLLVEGAGVVVLDNLEQPLTGETLCTVLTEPSYKGRTLGKSEMQSVSTNVTWAATGNNLTMKGDITTRFLLCQMDAKVERPEERTFKSNLDQYVPAHRAELVTAGLILLRAFFISTAKPQLAPYGRFEAWSDLVRGAVVWIGLPDPLDTRKEIDANDPVRESLKAVLTAWHEAFGEKPVLMKEVISADTGSADLVDALEGAVFCRGGLNAKAVGRWLSKHKERRIDGLRLVSLGGDKNGVVWKVAQG